MVKKAFILAFLVPFICNGQEAEVKQYPHAGLWRSQATISLGQKRGDFTHMYLHGDLGYHLTDDIEIRGEIYYFLNTLGDTAAFEYNHQLLFGALYHFNTGSNFDPYLGLQPGIALSKSASECPDDTQDALPWQCQQSANPLFTTVAGFNYYGTRWFHVFAQVRYVRGVHLGQMLPVHLDELRFSVGLGFNIN